MKLEVGKKVLLVWNQCLPPEEVTITKIGRKYAEIDYMHKKIDIEKMTVGEPPTYAKVYESEDDYIAETKTQLLWDDFRYKIGIAYRKPENITDEQIKKFMDALK
jgi:hypothetical protein